MWEYNGNYALQMLQASPLFYGKYEEKAGWTFPWIQPSSTDFKDLEVC